MVIGKIKMAPGNVGWFDPISRIALTQANPVSEIRSEMNLETVRRGLHYGTILLLEGTVDQDEIVKMLTPEPVKVDAVKQKAVSPDEVTVEIAAKDSVDDEGTIKIEPTPKETVAEKEIPAKKKSGKKK